MCVLCVCVCVCVCVRVRKCGCVHKHSKYIQGYDMVAQKTEGILSIFPQSC